MSEAVDFDKVLTYTDIHGEEATVNYKERALHSELSAIPLAVRKVVFDKQFGGYAPFMRDIAFYNALLATYTQMEPMTPDILDMYMNGVGGANLLHKLLEVLDKTQVAQAAAWTDDMIEYEKKKDGMALLASMIMEEAAKEEDKNIVPLKQE